MLTKSVVVCLAVALAVMLTAEAVELCQLVFTTDPRVAVELPETRPYLIQIPNEPLTVFYDDGESINAQTASPGGATPQIVANRDPKDMMTFGVSTFKDASSAYLVWQNRPASKLGRVVASYPFDAPSESTYTAGTLTSSAVAAPVAVAAQGNNIAFAWIGWNNADGNVMMISRSVNAGQDFLDFQLKYYNPISAAITLVENLDLYGAPTYLAVYQEALGGTNVVRLDATDPIATPAEERVVLTPTGVALNYLSIAALKKQPYFVVTGQTQTIEGTTNDLVIAVLDVNFTPVHTLKLDRLRKPSLYITEFDEIYVSYLAPDNSTCFIVYEDPLILAGTMAWCSAKYPLQAPSWSGLTADDLRGYLAMTVVREDKSVVDLYECDFGCGNGVVSPSRGEQCDVGSANCDITSCTCAVGSVYSIATESCVIPVPPQTPPVAPPTTPPVAVPVASTAADVLPILDCNARINQTHFRTYLSYDTRTPGVASVNVPIGEKNMFTPIAPNQGQPTKFFAGRSAVFNTAVDITAGSQRVDWILTKYRLSITDTEANKCSTEILFQIGLTSPTPPSEPFINATINYIAWVFNVSSNNVSINVTQGEQPNVYVLNVSVQVTVDAIIETIEQIRSITEDSTEFEDHIKDINPDVDVTGVRGQPTGVNNPATFEAEPIAPNSSSCRALTSVSVLALSLVALL